MPAIELDPLKTIHNEMGEIRLHVGLVEKDVTRIDAFSERLLISIEKIQDVSNKLLQMLALHEEKLSRVNDDFGKNRIKHDEDVRDLNVRVTDIQRELYNKIEELEVKINIKLDSLITATETSKTIEASKNTKNQNYLWGISGFVMAMLVIYLHGDISSLINFLK